MEDITSWYDNLQSVAYADLPGSKGIVVTDMVNGFVHEGPLASPRVKALVEPIRNLCVRAVAGGTHLFVSLQDTHREDALEFKSFPPHCIEGTAEAELIPELQDVPCDWHVFEKNTLNAGLSRFDGLGGMVEGWVQQRNPTANRYPHNCNIRTFIVVGNCTDLCVYQTAMFLRLHLNELHWPWNVEVVVPANLVDTYDLKLGLGEMGNHDADFFNKVFLYHMALNGIKVVKEITF